MRTLIQAWSRTSPKSTTEETRVNIQQIISEQAAKAGIDPGIALAIAQAESSLNPRAKNPASSATGLFQITKGTWSQFGGKDKMQKDPEENARVAMKALSSNISMLKQTLGREPSATEVYATHVFGRTGGKKLLSAAPDDDASVALSPAALKSNKLSGKKVKDILSWLGSKVPSKSVFPQETPAPAYDVSTAVPAQTGTVQAVTQAPANRSTMGTLFGVDGPELTNILGPGYQAALGASYLADSDDTDPDTKDLGIVEKFLQSGPSESAKLLREMDMSVAPAVGYADGGLASSEDPESTLFEGYQSDPVSAAQMLKGLGKTVYGMGKGATQATLGMPGDLELFGRALAGKSEDTYLPTTDKIREFLNQYVPSAGEGVEGTDGRAPAEYFGEWMDISGLAKPAVKAAKAAPGVAASMLSDLTKPRNPVLSQMGAVRPYGTGIMVQRAPGMPPEKFGLDDMLETAKQEMDYKFPQGPQRDAVKNFIDTKARDYFSKSVASTKDPLYDALIAGKVNTGNMDRSMRQYLVDAAVKGDQYAREDLLKQYDGQVKTSVYTPETLSSDERYALKDLTASKMYEQMLAQNERRPPNTMLLPDELTRQSRYAINDVDEYGANLGRSDYLNRMLAGDVPDNVKAAMQYQDPLYSIDDYRVPNFMRPSVVAEELMDIPAEKLAKMSYPEAVLSVNKRLSQKADYMASVSRVREGKNVPKQVWDFGTAPIGKAASGDKEWVRLTDPLATELEGASMGHSVAGYNDDARNTYGLGGRKAFVSGKAEIYSLRNKKGIPSVTIEGERLFGPQGPMGLRITQVKGPRNEFPANAMDDVLEAVISGKIKNVESMPTEYYYGSGVPERRVDWEQLLDSARMQNTYPAAPQ